MDPLLLASVGQNDIMMCLLLLTSSPPFRAGRMSTMSLPEMSPAPGTAEVSRAFCVCPGGYGPRKRGLLLTG